MQKVSNLDKKLKETKKILEKSLKNYKKIALAYKTGKETTVILDIMLKMKKRIPFPVIFIDTDQHFQETYEFLDQIRKLWLLDVRIFKNERALKEITPGKDKEECCHRLKTEPLNGSINLHKFDAIITGIRRDEQPDRINETHFSKRDTHDRIHPVLDWTEAEIWRYINKYKVPYNPLYDKGYRSIDCKLCTKVSSKGERAGRSPGKEKVMKKLRTLGYF